MKNSNLETTLRNWFEEMVNRYTWLSIKFEYSEKKGVFLVSYAPISEINSNEEFISESMDFEDKMNALYGDSAPLFCDEEKYFKLSEKAEIFKHINVQILRLSYPFKRRIWNLSSNITSEMKPVSYYSLAA